MKTFKLECPVCRLSAKARLDRFCMFMIYTCPKCHSNVVYYDHKVRVLSESLVSKLIHQGKLKHCGDISFRDFKKQNKRDKPISDDDLVNLKILLATEKDISQVISRI